jgi:hypothetical protein
VEEDGGGLSKGIDGADWKDPLGVSRRPPASLSSLDRSPIARQPCVR